MWSQIRDGKVRYFERYKIGGEAKTLSVTYPKDTAANRKAAQTELLARIQKAQIREEKGPTLAEVIDKYNAYQKRHMRPATYIRNARTLRITLDYLDGEMPVNDLTAGYIKEYLPDDKPSTFNQRIMRLKACLRWAYENDLIKSIDFLRKIKPLETDYKQKLQEKFLEKDELKKILKKLKIKKWKLVTEFLALTGLRINELVALEVKDVDLKKRTIRVNKTFMPTTGKVSPFTKTATSMREVYIQDELVPVIKEMLEERTERSEMLVPGAPHFKYMNYDAYRQYLGDKSQEAIGRRITPHALRHTMTSLMAAEGVSLDIISRRLGHSSSAITARVYFHVTQNLKKTDSDRIKGVKLM